MHENDTPEKKQRLYDSLKDVQDEHTRQVLYSQFVDMYYQDAFNAIQNLFSKGQIHRNTPLANKENK